jgi:hypothetical protein
VSNKAVGFTRRKLLGSIGASVITGADSGTLGVEKTPLTPRFRISFTVELSERGDHRPSLARRFGVKAPQI